MIRGTFTIVVPGSDGWNLDSFLQEIVLHRGLYYYLCGVVNRREVAKLVVAPIFEELRSSRFSVTYPVQNAQTSLEWNRTLGRRRTARTDRAPVMNFFTRNSA